MSQNNGNRSEQAIALFGLRAADSAAVPVGAPPSPEDFAALYEGSLDATRRAQVLSHIVADQEIYQSWLAAVDAQSSLDTALDLAADSEQEAPSLFEKLRNWMGESLLAPVGGGAFAAAALVAVLLIPGGEEAERWDDIDNIYSKYSGQWGASPESLHDRTVRSTRPLTNASAEQQALYTGMREGLDGLEPTFPDNWLPPVTVNEDMKALSPELQETFAAAGKLATLARFQCQLNGSDEFFASAEQALDKLGPALRESGTRTAVDLVKVIEQPGTASERVCDFAIEAVSGLKSR